MLEKQLCETSMNVEPETSNVIFQINVLYFLTVFFKWLTWPLRIQTHADTFNPSDFPE